MSRNTDCSSFEIDSFYGNKVAYNYFKKLQKIKGGEKILDNYKEYIKKCVNTGMPLYFVFDRSEFINNDYVSVRNQLNEKLISLTCLAEKMGYLVKNKGEGLFFDEDCVGIIIYLEKALSGGNLGNITNFMN